MTRIFRSILQLLPTPDRAISFGILKDSNRKYYFRCQNFLACIQPKLEVKAFFGKEYKSAESALEDTDMAKKNLPPRNRRKTAKLKAKKKARVLRKKRLSPHGKRTAKD